MARGELERLYPTGQRNFVRIAAADHLAPVALVQAAKELRRSRVFVLWDRDDSYMAGFADDMRAAARTLGLDVVGAAGWDPGARDFARLARRVAAARPEAVLMAGAAPPATPALLRDLRAHLGRRPALIASDGFADFERLRESGRAAQGMYVANAGIPNAELPPAGRRLLAAAGRPEDDPDFSFAYGAQAAEILLDAIARSDGTRASVTRELRAHAGRGRHPRRHPLRRQRRPRRGARDDLPVHTERADGRSRHHRTSDRRRVIASRVRCGARTLVAGGKSEVHAGAGAFSATA